MIRYKMACKIYGIRPLTENQERNLSDNEKVIRECKINIINLCNEVRKAVKIIDDSAVNAEEVDDVVLKDRLVDLRTKMRKISSDIVDVATVLTEDEVSG